MLGLFTQWSGNTLISYYLGDLLAMIGKSDSVFKQQINVASSCWQLVCGTCVAFLVTRFKRRQMYLVCTVSLLCVYIAWTISMERAISGKESGRPNDAANVATIFWIFAYSPCYNIGYNALTYSKLLSFTELIFPLCSEIVNLLKKKKKQHIWWSCGRTPSVLEASRSFSSSVAWLISSPHLSIRSA